MTLLRNGTLQDSATGNYIMRDSNPITSQTYSKTLSENTTYYLSFAYSIYSSYYYTNRWVISNIKFAEAFEESEGETI